jgi:soluble lytic murein transglycosylase-like protein
VNREAILGGLNNEAKAISRKDFLRRIDFPATRKYVESILARYDFYKRRGRM